MKKIILLVVGLCLGLTPVAASAQDILTKGSIRGTVVDTAGAVIQGAKVMVTGLTGERVVTTNDAGEFDVPNLIPGSYTAKAEQSGFKTASVANIVVYVGKTTTLRLTLEPGAITEVVEVAAGAGIIDQTSTAVGANLNDQLYQNLPLQRSVTSLFYIGPGATDSLQGGNANPSISGGSALDNLYVADGINITDSAFGGLGVFTRSYGTLGVGINTSYIKEVQVKTGGFEPQYGQSQGGIVNIITKSGGNGYHGTLFGYIRPNVFEGQRRQPDDTRVNKFGKMLHEENYDGGFDLGGPIPGLRDKMFFFGSFNPSQRRELVRGAVGSGLLRDLGTETNRGYFTKNYAFKLDFNLHPSHQINFSIFGDPTVTNLAPFRTLNIDNTTATSKLEYGTRNIAVRYNGTLTPTLTLSASFSQGANTFDESGFANFNQIINRTQPARGNFTAIGLGFFEPTNGTTYRTTYDVAKQASILGQHTFGVGYQFQRGFYSGRRDRSGPRFSIPTMNATGVPLANLVGARSAAIAAGQMVNAAFSLRTAGSSCTLCPILTIPGVGDTRVYLRQDRGEFGEPVFDTKSDYHAAYVQDTWRLNRFVTALVGWRWEQERLIGAPGPESGRRLAYSFTGNWSPRLGVTVDPFGRGKTKAYYNFGRFHEYIPLDLAERSLSAELDFTGGRFAPDFFVDAAGVRRARLNQFGTVIPIIDAMHFLTGATGGTGATATVSAQDPTNPILAGTKLGYAQEHLVGFEQQLPGNLVLSVRYIDRRLKRIVEDAAVVPPEGADFFGQTYFIGNINASLDAAVNPIEHRFTGNTIPAACDPNLVTDEFLDFQGHSLGRVCFETLGRNGQPAGDPGADGVPDGFPDPVHKYRAVEIELNKRFSNNWQLIANWRIAKLEGNFEGHFRNDNGQTDPAISSLFDFTGGEIGLLGDQFRPGPLNTDRHHILNFYGSYAFSETSRLGRIKGLNLGAGLRMESGVPISEFLAHPIYLNAGEIPLGGRGKLGRTPFYAQLDLHVDYPYQISERVKLSFVADIFNVTNNRRLRLPDQNRESTRDQPNPDFLQPAINSTNLNLGFHLPTSLRLGLRLDF
jgi:hypothetical protein